MNFNKLSMKIVWFLTKPYAILYSQNKRKEGNTMKNSIARGTCNLSYIYDATRKGAKYSINNGKNWMNGGEFMEAVAKALFGLDAHKDACTRFDVGSDIPEYAASVKSSAASLTNMKLADTLEASVDAYFIRTASREFWYVTMLEDEITVYRMNAETFRRFLLRFGRLNERGVVRLAKTSSKTLAWLNANVR